LPASGCAAWVGRRPGPEHHARRPSSDSGASTHWAQSRTRRGSVAPGRGGGQARRAASGAGRRAIFRMVGGPSRAAIFFSAADRALSGPSLSEILTPSPFAASRLCVVLRRVAAPSSARPCAIRIAGSCATRSRRARCRSTASCRRPCPTEMPPRSCFSARCVLSSTYGPGIVATAAAHHLLVCTRFARRRLRRTKGLSAGRRLTPAAATSP